MYLGVAPSTFYARSVHCKNSLHKLTFSLAAPGLLCHCAPVIQGVTNEQTAWIYPDRTNGDDQQRITFQTNEVIY